MADVLCPGQGATLLYLLYATADGRCPTEAEHRRVFDAAVSTMLSAVPVGHTAIRFGGCFGDLSLASIFLKCALSTISYHCICQCARLMSAAAPAVTLGRDGGLLDQTVALYRSAADPPPGQVRERP